jgi:predicted GIY-YIG superfamily endonuclease
MGLHTYFVYMMTNLDRSVLYIGMTNDLERRVAEHKSHALRGFTDTYNVTVLVYFEAFGDPIAAIHREKQLKGWTRKKKNALVGRVNPSWKEVDLTAEAEA